MVVLRLLVAVWCALISVSWAAEAELRLDPPEIQEGGTTAVRVRVRGDKPTAPPRVAVQPGVGLDLRLESQGSSVSIYNSRVREHHDYIFRLTATEQGVYTVGPADVEIGTRTVRAQAARLTVRERTDAPEQGLEAYAGFTVDTAYVGQVVVFRRGIRSAAPVAQDRWTSPPLDGLLPPRDGDPSYAEYSLDSESGRVYVKEEYYPKIVVSPGMREVPAGAVRLVIPDRGGLRHGLGRRMARREAVATERSTLEVLPLPSQPKHFSGLVGTFEFDISLDRRQVSVGDSVNVELRVQGDGALESFSVPELDDELPVRVYDGSPSTSARIDTSGYRSEGVFTRVLVPTQPGLLDLPSLKVVTFDPERAEFVTHSLDLGQLRVAPGDGGAETSDNFMEDLVPEARDEVVQDAGVREVTARGWAHTAWLGGVLPWTLSLSALPLLVLGSIVGGSATVRLGRRLRRPLRTREPSVRQQLARLPEDPDLRLGALDALLRRALAERVGQPLHTLDRTQACATLPEELAADVLQVGRRLDRVRFAGDPADDIEAQVRSLITRLRRGRRGRP